MSRYFLNSQGYTSNIKNPQEYVKHNNLYAISLYASVAYDDNGLLTLMEQCANGQNIVIAQYPTQTVTEIWNDIFNVAMFLGVQINIEQSASAKLNEMSKVTPYRMDSVG
jgi:hypothetical protein